MKVRFLLVTFFLIATFQSFGQICAVDAGTDVSICPGESTTLQATVTDTLDYRYIWSPLTGLNDSTLQSPTASPLETTVYRVTITRTDSTELVVNGDFEQGSQSFTSAYKDSISTWNLGTYNVTNFPPQVHPGFTACADHTPSPGSNMMVVNGSNVPNVVVWEQTINVTPFTNYEFSTWVTNMVVTQNLPELQFSINGSLIGPVFTSLPNPCDWSQFFTVWFSDTATTATITIVNQSTITIGNDFAIDDISFRAVCIAEDSVTVTVNELFSTEEYGLGQDTVLCDGNPMTLSTSVPGATNHQWQDGSTNSTLTIASGGTYSVSLTDENNCPFSDSILVREGNSPQVTLPADTLICADNIVTFNAFDPTATAYQWRGPSVYFLQNDPTDTTFTATFPGVYEVDVTNECGTLTQLIELKTEDCTCSPYVPTAFSPNNDGDNDLLYVYSGCDITEVNFQLFNRWGGLVFETTNLDNGWDGLLGGNLAPTGVYIYKLQYTSQNFKGEVVNSVTYGDITLIR